MATILCLETATTNCSVAIGINGVVKALIEENSPKYSHSENLHAFVEEAVREAGLLFSDLDGVAVSKGPGSYTGLRIGVSAAKGLCFALDIPLLAIPTLESMGHQLKVGPNEVILPLLDARRMEVYSCAFDHDYKALTETRAEIISESSFEMLSGHKKVHLVGSGAKKCMEVLRGDHFVFQPDLIPSARELVALAEEKQLRGDFEDAAYFEPYYLKDFVLQGKKKA